MKNRTEQNRTEQNRTEQNRTEQNRTEQNRTEQNPYLCLDTCNCLKAFAILCVMTGHYYRYGEIVSVSGVFRSVGFFGAALFAFLSGYGTCISYLKKGFGDKRRWLLGKVVKIYLPFLSISFLSEILLYRVDGKDLKSFMVSILLNSDDTVMWYIFFVLGFNVVFLLVFSVFDRGRERFWPAFLILLFAGVVQIFISPGLGMGSQWYTSTGALLLGILFAKDDLFIKMNISGIYRRCGIILAGCAVLLFMIYISRAYSYAIYLKDGSTVIAGMAFCTILFFIAVFFDGKSSIYVFKPFVTCGEMSLWIYIIHMKIMTFLGGYFKSYLMLFLAVSLVSAYLLYYFSDKGYFRIKQWQ